MNNISCKGSFYQDVIKSHDHCFPDSHIESFLSSAESGGGIRQKRGFINQFSSLMFDSVINRDAIDAVFYAQDREFRLSYHLMNMMITVLLAFIGKPTLKTSLTSDNLDKIIKEINDKLKSKDLPDNLRKSLEEKKRILTNNSEVKK